MIKSLLILLTVISAAEAFAPGGRMRNIPSVSPKFELHESVQDTIGQQIPTTDVDIQTLSRRNAVGKVGAMMFSALTVMTSSDAAHADIYDDQEKARKLKAKEDGEKGKKLLPLILFGGVGLSVPFFLPNLIRLGKKVSSGGEDDGYGK